MGHEGSYIREHLAMTGRYAEFLLATFGWLFRRPFRWKLVLEHMEKIGVNSLLIISLSSVTVGMIFSLEVVYILRIFRGETFVGAMMGVTMGRELAPVMTALMLIAKNGSAMAAELGTMKVTDQISAMETMAVSPIHYLVVPRLIASVLVYPALTGLANALGILGAYVVSVLFEGVDSARFFDRLYFWVDPKDVYGGLIKAAVFAVIITTISCFYGLTTRQGAKGVGESTTKAVVASSVAVLVADYVLSDILISLLYDA